MQRILRRLVLPAMLLANLGGCGGHGAAPSPAAPLNLPAGVYAMTVVATDSAACTPKWDQPVPATLPVALTIEQTADGWAGRTRSGDLHMTLASQPGTARIVPVSGTLRGTSIVASGLDDVISLGLRFSGVNESGPAVIAGSAFPPSTAVHGEIRGKTTFLGSLRPPMVCSYVEFTLFRPE